MYVNDINDPDELKDLLVEVESRIIRAQHEDASNQALEDYQDILERLEKMDQGIA